MISDFCKWTQLEFDKTENIFFLLTFPFYEHKWDLVGFLTNSFLGIEEDDDIKDEEKIVVGTA